jgi:hypothetical protein
MLRLLRKFGDLLDALDLGGWLCVVSGMAIVSVTVLAPAWLDVRELRYEQAILRRQAALLDARRQNYEGFVQAIERDDPMLLTRLAWHHLRLSWLEPQVVEVGQAVDGQTLRVDEWMRPTASQLPAVEPLDPLPESRLVRLVLGPPRPWVLAMGGWLILVGLLVTPRRAQPVARAAADEPSASPLP